jgi:hypothetical protein
LFFALALCCPLPSFADSPTHDSTIAFSRIVHGWTNYSTAFNVTSDTGALGDFVSAAALYAPDSDVTPLEYGVIVIGTGTRPPDFGRFTFGIFVWSSRDAFVRDPKEGDIKTWSFAAPTGGSTSVADAITRGGRPAYALRFCLTNGAPLLRSGQDYWVGFSARTDTQRYGELYVPTSSHEGVSDVQAGDLVVGGWLELVNAGGSTIYSGQLATELLVRETVPEPRLSLERVGNFVRICWPVAAADFVLESASTLSAAPEWFPVDGEPITDQESICVEMRASFERQWFRLRK